MSNASSASSSGSAVARASQDVFFERDETGRIHLAEGDHAGNHFFRSLAELNRTRFMTKNAGDRVALSIVHTIWGNARKGQGKIYLREANDEWSEVKKIGEAQILVTQALETLLGFPGPYEQEVPDEIMAAQPIAHDEQASMRVSIVEQENSSPEQEKEQHQNEQHEHEDDGTERRHSARTLIGASSLLMIQSVRSELEQFYEKAEEQEQQEEKAALQVQFENTNIAMMTSFESNSSSSTPSSPESDDAKAAASMPKKKRERRRRSACPASDFASEKPGIGFAEVQGYDVLCGGSGEGVLAIRHEGNTRFLNVIESEMEDFYSADEKTKLRIAQQAVEGANPRGRFLAYNPETGLWHELKRDKAWFKSLRTFLKRQKRHEYPEEANQKQRSLPRPVQR